MTIEVPLTGGRITAGVVRVDDEVRRPVSPQSDFVHAVLAAFEDAGISGAPALPRARQARTRAALL